MNSKPNSLHANEKTKAIITVSVWIVISIFIGLIGLGIGIRTIIPGPASTDSLLSNAGEKKAIAAGIFPKDSILIILNSLEYSISSPEFIAARDELVELLSSSDDLRDLKISFERIRTDGHSFFFDEKYRSIDNHHLLIIADTKIPLDGAAEKLRLLPKVLKDWGARYGWLSINYISSGLIDDEMFNLINADLDFSLIYSLPLTAAILIWAFRSLSAALVPLIVALVSLVNSLGLSALISHAIEPISATSSQLVVLLVLAIGIDYSLFMLSRVREEVSHGRTYFEAILISRNTTGRAIFWSGLTVALSLLGLTLMDDSVLTSMAVVSIVSVFITLGGCLFALPSLLFLLGGALNYGQSRPIKPNFILQKVLKLSITRPILMATTVSAFVGTLGLFSLTLKLGTTIEPKIFPNSMQSTQSYRAIEKHFPDLAGVDFSLIISSTNKQSIRERDEISALIDELLLAPNIRGPLKVEFSTDDSTVRYKFIALGSGNDPANQQIVQKLRKNLIPSYLGNSKLTCDISGTLPYVVDEMKRYSTRTPLVFAVVLMLSFCFLLIAFRSIIVPIKAIILNVLSTAASFGILALVFQLGIFGHWNYGVIEGFVPALLYSILFGLSMDYHVFLLSRTQEEVQNGLTTRDAVQNAVIQTSRSITSAALIMVSVFAIIATLELPIMKELGVGLAVAVFLDATLIRSILLPASLVLLGRWNWYLPRWLECLPRIKD